MRNLIAPAGSYACLRAGAAPLEVSGITLRPHMAMEHACVRGGVCLRSRPPNTPLAPGAAPLSLAQTASQRLFAGRFGRSARPRALSAALPVGAWQLNSVVLGGHRAARVAGWRRAGLVLAGADARRRSSSKPLGLLIRGVRSKRARRAGRRRCPLALRRRRRLPPRRRPGLGRR